MSWGVLWCLVVSWGFQPDPSVECPYWTIAMEVDSVRFCFASFYGPVNPMGSCGVWSVYQTTLLLVRLMPLSSIVHILSLEKDSVCRQIHLWTDYLQSAYHIWQANILACNLGSTYQSLLLNGFVF